MEEVQERLAFWDTPAAERAWRQLNQLEPQADATLYLGGAVAFFRGDYAEAKALFSKVSNLSKFEKDKDGFVGLTEEILAAGVQFRKSRAGRSEVHFQEGRDEVLVDYIEDGMARIRASVAKDLGFDPEGPVVVEIYPNADSFIAASPLTEADVKTSGTIALCKYGRILLTTPRSLLRGYPWMDTLSHEYIHFVLARRWGNSIPVWFHEGMAKALEARWRGEAWDKLSPLSENLLAAGLRQKNLVTFKEMHPSFAKLPSAERAQLAYAQVQTLMHYLIQERGGFPLLIRVLDGLRAGKEVEPAFQESYGQSLAEILRQWEKWLRGKGLREVEGLDPVTLEVVDANGARSEEEAELGWEKKELSQLRSPGVREHVHLGDLLRARGRILAASKEYEAAQAKLKGVSPLVGTKLGLVFQKLGRTAEAEKAFREVLHYYPEQGLALQGMGEMAFQKRDFAEAAKHFRAAIEINPYNPRTFEKLAKAYYESNNKIEAERAQKALQILLANERR